MEECDRYDKNPGWPSACIDFAGQRADNFETPFPFPFCLLNINSTRGGAQLNKKKTMVKEKERKKQKFPLKTRLFQQQLADLGKEEEEEEEDVGEECLMV